MNKTNKQNIRIKENLNIFNSGIYFKNRKEVYLNYFLLFLHDGTIIDSVVFQ